MEEVIEEETKTEGQVTQPEAGAEEKVDTAATEEKSSTDDAGLITEKKEGTSIEDIMGDKPKTDAEIDAETVGVGKKAQARIEKRISNAVKERNLERDRATIAEARIKELETEKLAPTERPLVPLREDYDLAEDYQKEMDKYQDDTILFNTAQETVKVQTGKNVERGNANDERFIAQADELKERYPDIYDTVEKTEYGNAKFSIQDSEHSARIGLYLALNPTALAKMSSLTDHNAINREIGKLEERFNNMKTNTTNAPAPLNITTGEAEAVTKDGKDMNDTEWHANYKRDRLAKLKRKLQV